MHRSFIFMTVVFNFSLLSTWKSILDCSRHFAEFLGKKQREKRGKKTSLSTRTKLNKVSVLGNPKTLTLGPRTSTTDRVRGLPMDRCTDSPYGPPLRTTPQNIIKIINKYFSYGLSKKLLVTAKFRTSLCKWADLDSG